jgi:methylated-DNA-[protein]-cysteine S-methyltransferase
VAPGVTPSASRADPLHAVTCDTALGPFVVALGPAGVVATAFAHRDRAIDVLAAETGRPVRAGGRGFTQVRREVEGYFAGRVRSFSTPVDPSIGTTVFSRAVLAAAQQVPYGELRTYGDLASAAGRPRAARAAGSVMATCPIELFVPCHRIVRAGPSLGSYGSANDRRRFLLMLEGSFEPGGDSLPRAAARAAGRSGAPREKMEA